jgi:hypothetical protein
VVKVSLNPVPALKLALASMTHTQRRLWTSAFQRVCLHGTLMHAVSGPSRLTSTRYTPAV